MSSRKFHDSAGRPYHCHAIIHWIAGESCKNLTTGKKVGVWAGFVFIILAGLAGVLLLAFGIKRIISLVNPKHEGEEPKPNYTWADRWHAYKWGGMKWYRESRRLEEEDRVFKEQLQRLGPNGVEIPIIRGWNCAESREKERKMAQDAARDEEAGIEGRDVSPSRAGIALENIVSQRGGKLSLDKDTSDDETEKVIMAKGFGKGSSSSTHGSRQRSSRKKRSQRKR